MIFKILKRKGFYIGIGEIGKRGFLIVWNLDFINSIKWIFVFMDLSLMFLMRKILKIFTAIKSSSRNTIITFLLCLYTWSADYVFTVSLKHWFSICHLEWQVQTVFFKSSLLSVLGQGRFVTQIQFALPSLFSKLFPSFEWTLPGVASSDTMTLTFFTYPSQHPSTRWSQIL